MNTDARSNHAVVAPLPIHCPGNTLFKNSQTARRKCGGTPSCTNHECILVCRCTSCSSSGRTFLSQPWWIAPFRRRGRKQGPRSLSRAMPAWKLKANILSGFLTVSRPLLGKSIPEGRMLFLVFMCIFAFRRSGLYFFSLRPTYDMLYRLSCCLWCPLTQCFSTAGPRPGTEPWHQLHRTAKGLRKSQYATRFH